MSAKFPTVGVVQEALGALAELFQSLPKGVRDRQAGNYSDVRRLLERVKRLAADYESLSGEKSGKPEPAREAEMLEVVAMLSEQIQVILKAIAELPGGDQDRRMLFTAIGETYCVACGAVVKGEQDEHECPFDEDEDEDEEEEDDA